MTGNRALMLGLLTTGMLSIFSTTGCASSNPGPSRFVRPGEPVTLQPGERVGLPDHSVLRYVAVIADSRCPPGITCVRAGDADVAFEYSPATGPGTMVTLNTDRSPSMPIGPWQLRWLSLEFGDAPAVTVQVDAGPR